MRLNDAVFGALLLVLAAAVLLDIRSFPNIPGQQVGPAVFPGVIAAGLAICGALLIARGIRLRAPIVRLSEGLRSPRHLAALVVVVAGTLAYITLVDRVGFLILSPVLLAALLWSFGVAPARSFVVAIIATLVIHYAFYKLLRVPLPWGLLTNWAF